MLAAVQWMLLGWLLLLQPQRAAAVRSLLLLLLQVLKAPAWVQTDRGLVLMIRTHP
jgi:hypothetical protein